MACPGRGGAYSANPLANIGKKIKRDADTPSYPPDAGERRGSTRKKTGRKLPAVCLKEFEYPLYGGAEALRLPRARAAGAPTP